VPSRVPMRRFLVDVISGSAMHVRPWLSADILLVGRMSENIQDLIDGCLDARQPACSSRIFSGIVGKVCQSIYREPVCRRDPIPAIQRPSANIGSRISVLLVMTDESFLQLRLGSPVTATLRPCRD
jgi:hypothetical protein